jgi:hypothetical protein
LEMPIAIMKMTSVFKSHSFQLLFSNINRSKDGSDPRLMEMSIAIMMMMVVIILRIQVKAEEQVTSGRNEDAIPI